MKEIVTELSPFVFPFLKGGMAMQGLVHQEMWRVCRDFCRDTQIWKQKLVLNIQADLQDYYFLDLFSDDGKFERIYQILMLSGTSVIPEDTPGVPLSNGIIPSSIYTAGSENTRVALQGADYVINHDENEEIFIHLVNDQAQDISNGLIIIGALLPTQDSLAMPDFMSEYRDALAAGVLASFHKRQGLPCYSLVSAQEQDRLYFKGLAEARMRLNQNVTSQELFVSYNGGW